MTLPRPRRPLRASTRRALATSTIGIVLVALGVLAGEGPAIGDQTTATTLGYTCQFPSGAQQLQAQVNATFPETAAANAPIEPTDVSTKIDIPQVALGDLTTINAASVTTKADFSVVVKHDGSSQTSNWPDLIAPSAPVPSTGDLTITAAGVAQPVSETGSGDISFAADAFGLLFTPLTTTGTATSPATVAVACTLNPDQTATLATVVIPSTPSTTTTTPGTTGASNGSAASNKKHNAKPADDTPPVDPQCSPDRPGGTGFPGDNSEVDAMILARTNLNNLNESSSTGGTVKLFNNGSWFSDDFTIFTACYIGEMDLSPSTTTILGFGFVPITTTLKYVQANTPDNPMMVEASSNSDPIYPDGLETGQSTSLVNIYVSSASINGTPLNVGDDCHTSTPVLLGLSNIDLLDSNNIQVYPYSGVTGGYMQGNVTVPPFEHCGVDDNLDTLLSAPVAGPDNLTRICQGLAQDPGDGPPPPPDEADDHCTTP